MSTPELAGKAAGGLFEEAERQLRICNACRYCDGYCAVFTSLERRPRLTAGDLTQLAHLCHDCRNCFYACMYSPPHAFAVNPPQLFSALRRATYDRQRRSLVKAMPPALRGWHGTAAVTVIAALLLLAAAQLSRGTQPPTSVHGSSASPYSVIPYAALVTLVLIASAWSALTMLRMARRHWTEIRGSATRRLGWAVVLQTVADAGQLRYLKGGGAGCAYPDQEPAPARRRFHAAILYGFAALLLSTVSASVAQHLLGAHPPYPIASVPVGLGIAGGASVVLGCSGLLILKARMDTVPADARMTARDYGLLVTLDLLAVTGLLTLALRDTPAYAAVLTAHLSLVVAAILAAPYSKILHAVYRFLSILEDNAERAARQLPAS